MAVMINWEGGSIWGVNKKAMGWGETRGSQESQHADHTVNNVVGQFVVAFFVGHRTLFK